MLPEMAFKPVGKRMTLEGGKGGSSGKSTSTNYTTTLPEYAKPYYQELLKQSGREVFQTDASGRVIGMAPYEPYEGQRIAGFTPEQMAIQGETFGLQTPQQFQSSQAGMEATQQAGMGLLGAGLNSALGYQAGPLEQMGMSATPIWNQQLSDYYSSPYQQAVTDTAIRKAQEDAERQRANFALGSIGRGTFGGAREGLMQVNYGLGTQQQIADIQSKGAQDAYLNAQQQFERDRSAGMTSEKATLDAETQRRALEEQARQYQAGIGKDFVGLGMSGLLDASKGLGALGATQQEADLARLQAQAASAGEQQALAQKALDTQYQSSMEARDWSKAQLQFYSDMLQGNAGALGSSQVQYSPAPSTTSQIAGLGLAGLGLYNSLK
jgi:hypothetical protein